MTDELKALRIKFLKEMRESCTHGVYMENIKSMSPEDLVIVMFETLAVLDHLLANDMPLESFSDLVEARLKKIWNLD